MFPDFYRYAAIFSYEEDGVHVVFPDLPGCITFGADEDEAVRMAREALALHIYGMEQDGDEIPQPSSLRMLAEQEDLQENEVFMLVEAFMPTFRERESKRFVKKTLSIPYWMNAEAERVGLNFSQTLQNAIAQKLSLAK
ncbi:type II toxin-antitoxin system HicB family antitoxin [Selenomonas sputigena]|jgi:hicB family toxin-antitoxin system|uniref:type II toxin-antitoxin system HicB family antitoxin n=1 Tax=Selenomonas sputigena TaxID=69823 RepID=UPI00223262AD|nr:type II toxin-antitoxin system HicB family antitoxin [Selenomonas sputigena]UZD42721.1 type II toxin-antitoxin system HicB family antitoxin [Selenomonas sputigena]